MQYEPIKKILGTFFSKNTFSRILFYRTLDLLLVRPWHVHRQLNSWVRKRKNALRILDAAAGFGHYSYYLSQKNDSWNIFSIDVNTEQVCACNGFFQKLKRHNVVFKTMDLVELHDKQAFDLILCLDVLEYIEDDQQVLSNFYDSLAEGGMLLISTPSLRSKKSTITEQLRVGYGKKELETRLKDLGFKHVKSKYTIGVFGKTSNLITLVIPVFLINLSKIFLFILPFYFLLFLPIIILFNFLDTVIKVIYGNGLMVNAWK